MRHIDERRAELGVAPPPETRKYIAIGVAAVLVAAVLALGILISVHLFLVMLVMLPMTALMCGTTVLMNQEKRRRALPMIAASSLATGRCGCCARELAGLAADPDGCVTCRSCGASWHADRWRSDRIGVDAVQRAVKYLAIPPDRSGCDDRGVAVDPNAYAKENWGAPRSNGPSEPPQLVAKRRELRTRTSLEMGEQRRRHFLMIAAFTVAMIAAAAVIDVLIDEVRGDEWSPGYFAAYAGPLYLSLSNTLYSRSRRLRAVALRNGMCPNCANVLNDSARVEFDGCVSCENCGRAWKAADVAHAPQSTPARQPWPSGAVAGEGGLP